MGDTFCNLGVFTPAERQVHAAGLAELTAAPATRLVDGCEWRFPADPVLAERLWRWALAERRCCPFFTFEIALEPEGGRLLVRVRGGPDAQPLLEVLAQGLDLTRTRR